MRWADAFIAQSLKSLIKMKLKDKVAIVTGSGRGIGRAIALELAKEGAKVVTNALHLKHAKSVAKEIKDLGSESLPVKADVSKKTDVKKMVDKAMKKFGRVDILVNNAGLVRFDPLMKISEKEWDKILDVNLRGAFLCTQAAAGKMMKNKSGTIINISSIAGKVGVPQLAHYCASKGGIIELTREMSLELIREDIRVNCVAPGAVETDMIQPILKDKKAKKSFLQAIPMGRFGKPEEIAKVVAFLASEDSSYIMGQTIFVDGGWITR
jgi:NAD(P)-dependent dehydrogenase (short-subunit alcohol dehydrogenase family)